MRLQKRDIHLTCKVVNKYLNVRERVEVVEWNKRWSPPFLRCPVNCQCLWKKTLIEKSASLTKRYTWSYLTWKTKCQIWNGYRRSDMTKHFLTVAINKWLLKFLVTFLCSFYMMVIVIVELNLTSCFQCKIYASHRDSRSKCGENGIHQCITLICISSFLSRKISVILIATLHLTVMPTY